MTTDLERIKTQISISDLVAKSGLTVIGKGHTLTTAEHISFASATGFNPQEDLFQPASTFTAGGTFATATMAPQPSSQQDTRSSGEALGNTITFYRQFFYLAKWHLHCPSSQRIDSKLQ